MLWNHLDIMIIQLEKARLMPSIKDVILLLSLLVPYVLVAQTNFVDKTELYRDDVLPRVDVYLPSDSLDWLYQSDNLENNTPVHATFVFSNGSVSDTIENVGFRLRGNTSRAADKKSFKVDLNAFIKGQSYYGVEKINLNGQHNDPTISRAKLCSFLGERMEVAYMRTNHVELFINGNYYGLYTNVEHIDERFIEKRFRYPAGNLFKCLYPADLAYKGDDPDLYKELIFGRRAYDLKMNVEEDNYDDFALFIDILNNTTTDELPCALEQIFNVDRYLKYIVFDILTGNWDGPIYNKNNFYLYYDLYTERFEYIPYDLDNTIGIDWLNRDWGTRNMYAWSQTDEDRPLYSKILEVQEYRDRFSFYMEEALLGAYQSSEFELAINNIIELVEDAVENDSYYSQDYGFDIQDFLDGFSEPLPYFQTDYGVLDFINERAEQCYIQLDGNYDIVPIIDQVYYNRPIQGELLFVQASATDDSMIENFELCVVDPLAVTNCYSMWDDGMHNDSEANDGIYGSEGVLTSSHGSYSIYLKATDDDQNEQRYPRCEEKSIYVNNSNFDLRINEFMARNDNSFFDSAQEADDWIELYNNGSSVVNLEGLYLTDNANKPFKFRLSSNVIVPGSYKIFWADDDQDQGLTHGPFKLSGSEGYVGLYRQDSNGEAVMIDEVSYGSQETDISFARIPNGTGPFEFSTPTPGYFNEALGIEQSNYDNSFKLYPNPSSGEVFIEAEEVIGEEVWINVYNTLGQRVYRAGLNRSERNTFSITENGLYYVSFVIDGQIAQTKKVVISL